MQRRREAAGVAALGLAVALGISACGVSQQQEVQIGQQESAQIQQQLPLVQDPVINQYVSSLGNQIASKTSRADLPMAVLRREHRRRERVRAPWRASST